jgi:L-amino acid N-acyltransferase YncA
VRSRPIVDTDRAPLADLMLDAYRGTVDDEGEGPDEALEAIDLYLRVSVRDHTIVVPADGDGDRLLAFCSVSIVDDVHYVDPIVVAAAEKGRGLGTRLVLTVLHSLAAAGVDELGATITDGNVPSERLFAALGFVRTGRWG